MTCKLCQLWECHKQPLKRGLQCPCSAVWFMFLPSLKGPYEKRERKALNLVCFSGSQNHKIAFFMSVCFIKCGWQVSWQRCISHGREHAECVCATEPTFEYGNKNTSKVCLRNAQQLLCLSVSPRKAITTAQLPKEYPKNIQYCTSEILYVHLICQLLRNLWFQP